MREGHFPGAPPEAERLACIRRRWPRHRWDLEGTSRWEWRDERFLGFGMGGALGASLYLEATLLAGKASPWFLLAGDLGLHPLGRSLIVLLATANAWILDRWIASRSPEEPLLPAWLRALRPVTVGLPVLGLAAVPVWRWLARRHRPGKEQSRLRLDLAPASRLRPGRTLGLAARLESWVWARGQSLGWLVAWMIACQITPFLAALSWLAGTGTLPPARRAALLAAGAALHGFAAAAGVFYVREQIQRTQAAGARAAVLRAIPFLLLVPGLALLAVAFWWPVSRDRREEAILTAGLYDSRRPHTLPRGGPLDPPSILRPGGSERHRLSFYRFKMLLLPLDAAACSWLACHLTGLRTLLPSQSAPFLLAALPGLVLTLAGAASRLDGRWPRLRALDRQGYGRALALAPVLLLAGWLFGSLLAERQLEKAGCCLVGFGLSAAALLLLAIAFGSAAGGSAARPDVAAGLWFLLWFEVTVLGVLLGSDSGGALVRLLELALLLAPVWSIGLFLALGLRLLHPFGLRHRRDRRLPSGSRALLAAVAASAALPLGGLAVPFWIYARHRLWPRLEQRHGEAPWK